MADRFTPFEQGDVEVRDAGGANFSFLHELDNFGPGVLDWCTGVIGPVKLIKIHAFDPQPSKRRFAFAPYGVRLEHTTRFFHRIVAIPNEAAFREHIRPFGRWQITQQAPDNFFRMAHAPPRAPQEPNPTFVIWSPLEPSGRVGNAMISPLIHK